MSHVIQQFEWHPEARLFDGRGGAQGPVDAGARVIPDGPGAVALARAMSVAGQGFRIGGNGPAPEAGSAPMFETLTSGSTGAARRIRRTQSSWTASFAVDAGLFGIGPGARVAVLGRLVQSLSLYAGIEALHLGAEAHLLDELRPDRQAAAIAARGITHLFATPAQLRLMPDATRWPALGHIILGGSKLDPALRARLAIMAPGARLREFYGSAETSFVTLADASDPPEAVGQPYPGVEIDLRAGEVWVRSPYLFAGYAGDPGGARWHEGWLSVGELGHWQGGALVLSGRAGRMVTVADQNVFPEEVEAYLMQQPGIVEAAVLPRPDPLRGQVLIAVLAGDPGREDDVLAAARRDLGPLKSPRRLFWRQEWPRTPAGKTDLAAIARGLL